MSSQETYVVWEWIDPRTATPVFVGWGQMDDGVHPADAIWNVRRTETSELTLWLRQFETQPRRINLLPRDTGYKHNAEATVTMRRSLLKRNGVRLLQGRTFESYAGGGKARPVFSPEGELYISVREAAAATGVQPATITRYCQSRKDGWRYFDDLLTPTELHQ